MSDQKEGARSCENVKARRRRTELNTKEPYVKTVIEPKKIEYIMYKETIATLNWENALVITRHKNRRVNYKSVLI